MLYELLDMDSVDRITVKARVHTDAPRLASVVDMFPGCRVVHIVRDPRVIEAYIGRTEAEHAPA